MTDTLSKIITLEEEIDNLRSILNNEFNDYIDKALDEIVETSLNRFRKTRNETYDSIFVRINGR